MTVAFNEPFEVTRKQYKAVDQAFRGLVATRTEGLLWWKRYYIKLMFASHAELLATFLNKLR